MGFPLSLSPLQVLELCDHEGLGCLNFDAFVQRLVGLGEHVKKPWRASHLRPVVEVVEDRPATPDIRNRLAEGIRAAMLSKKEAQRRAFQVFDTDGGGEVSYMEFRDGFHRLGLPAAPEQIKAIYDECSGKGGKSVTLEQFAERGMKIESPPPRAQVKPTVQQLDLVPEEPAVRIRAKSSIGSSPHIASRQANSHRGADISGFDHLAFSRGGGQAATAIRSHAGMSSVRAARTPQLVRGSMNLLQLLKGQQ